MLKLLVVIVYFWGHFAAANDAVWAQSDRFNAVYDHSGPPLKDASSRTLREIQCIQQSDREPAAMSRQPASVQTGVAIAPALERSIKEEKMGVEERRHFYAQMFPETGGLSLLTEAKRQTPNKGVKSVQEMAMVNLLQTLDRDSDYSKVKPNAKRSADMGEFRGRGLIQNTGCQNFLSAAHYLNLKYSGANPYWQAAWHATEKKFTDSDNLESHKINFVCSKEQREEMARIYKKKYNMDLDLFGAVSDPKRFAMLGGEFKMDPEISKKAAGHPCVNAKGSRCMSSEDFLVDASMASWRGRCGEKYKACLKIANPVDKVACVTKCVKGSVSQKDMIERHKWYERAITCVK